MTPDQLERAARLLCEKRGIEPEGHHHSFHYNWHNTAMEIQLHYEALTVICEVMDKEVTK